jgi:hypothetical protein
VEAVFGASVGLFQYAVPNLVAVGIIIGLVMYTDIYKIHVFIFAFICLLVLIAFLSSLHLALFLGKVSKEHSNFYKDFVELYLEKKEQTND